MDRVAFRKNKPGNLIKYEAHSERGLCRKLLTSEVPADAEVGLVFKSDEDDTYSPLVAADVAGLDALTAEFPLAVFVDNGFYLGERQPVAEGSTDYDVTQIVGGPGANAVVVLADKQLRYGDTLSTAQQDAVYAALRKQGIEVSPQV